MVKFDKKLFAVSTIFILVFLMYSSTLVAAAGDGSGSGASSSKNVPVSGNKVQNTVQANQKATYTFQEKTRVSIDSDVDVDASINCDANKIGNKNFELGVSGNDDRKLSMTMTCTMEETQLGLQNGSTVRTRHMNRYRYQEGFVASIESSENVSAELKLQANDNNAGGTWAYYDESTEEWVPVATSLQDGYLVCHTDHFSTWTILVPELDVALILIVGIVSTMALVGIIILIKKRK